MSVWEPDKFYMVGDILVKRPELEDPEKLQPTGKGPWFVEKFTGYGLMILRDMDRGDYDYHGCGWVGNNLQLRSTGEHP